LSGFDDLLAANAEFSAGFCSSDLTGVARAGVAVLLCMDSRIEPLRMLGLDIGDAKILRTPGGHLNESSLAGCRLAVQLLGCDRIMVVQHTKCAMASGDDADLIRRIKESTGADASGIFFGADPDQETHLRRDVATLRQDHLTMAATIGGFIYDVDSGRLRQIC